jgi:predicted ATPase
VVRGLYRLVANLAASGPVVLAVDDLHWAEEPSSRWLVYLCCRLEGLPVLIAATSRPPRSPSPQLLAELLAGDGIQVLRPGPLSHLAVANLLCKALGATPDPVFVTACTKSTGGNPFVLRELIADLAARGIRPDAAHATALIERVPVQVDRVVFARLERLDHATVRLARAVAVLGEEAELRPAAALAELMARPRQPPQTRCWPQSYSPNASPCGLSIRWCARR